MPATLARQRWLALGLLGASACSAGPAAGRPRAAPPVTTSSSPQQAQVKRLSLSTHGGCAIRDGGVSCWSAASPIGARALPLPEPARAVDGTLAFGCAVLESHAVHCWGDNDQGQLGAGSRVERSDVPLRSLGLDDVTAIAVGETHACAVRMDGSVACWGSNWAGQCGQDIEYSSAVRHLVLPANVAGVGGAEQIAVGSYASCALGAAGVACWGAILQTPEGLARAPDRTRPTPVPALTGARSIELGPDCGCALLRDGGVGCFGIGPHGCPSLDPLLGVPPLFDGRHMQRLVVGSGGACAASTEGSWSCWQHPIEAATASGPAASVYVPGAVRPAPFQLGDDLAYGVEPCALDAASLRCLEPSADGSAGATLHQRKLE